MRNLELPVSTYYVVFPGDGGGGKSESGSDGDDRMGAKIKAPQNP